jgi:hypothetical protein
VNEEDAPRDWWFGGFPQELEKATHLQKLYLQKRAARLQDLMDGKDYLALRLLGFNKWIEALSKMQASSIIGRLKDDEQRVKQEKVASSIAGSESAAESLAKKILGKCSVPKTISLVKSESSDRRCKSCGCALYEEGILCSRCQKYGITIMMEIM